MYSHSTFNTADMHPGRFDFDRGEVTRPLKLVELTDAHEPKDVGTGSVVLARK